MQITNDLLVLVKVLHRVLYILLDISIFRLVVDFGVDPLFDGDYLFVPQAQKLSVQL